jgi:hypothetical protein
MWEVLRKATQTKVVKISKNDGKIRATFVRLHSSGEEQVLGVRKFARKPAAHRWARAQLAT